MSTSLVAPLPVEESGFRDPSYVPEPLRPPMAACSQMVVDPLEKEASRKGFSKDIALNIEDLSSAVASKKNVDPEFLKILQHDIDTLHRVYDKGQIPHDSHVWSELHRMNVRLQEVATTMHGLAAVNHCSPPAASRPVPSPFGEDVSIPLVGKVEDPLTLCSDDSSPVNKGLQILHDEGYRVRRVRGNGHCLFSSIAAHLVTDERLAELRAKLPQLAEQGLLGAFDATSLIETCQQKLRDGVSVEALMQNERMYNDWVTFLRTIATNWWKKQIGQHGDPEVDLANAAREAMPKLRQKPSNPEVCALYLQSMASMSERRYGGVPEIFALGKALGVNINVIDAKKLGETASQEAMYTILPKVADLSEMWLLYRGSHFDPLYLAEQLQ